MSESAADDAYRGLPGAFPYAFRRSESRLFKLYVVVGAIAALVLGLLFTLGVIVLIANTVDTTASLSLSRTFFVVVGLFVVLPILTPILLVARRHRRGTGSDPRYDRRIALAGFGFLCSLYVGLIPTVPTEHQDVPDGVLGPVVAALYGLPWVIGLAIVACGAALIVVAHRRSR